MKDKIVLITGGTSGLGLATSKAFIDKGATVIIASRTRSKFENNFDQNNENIVFVETDFSSMSSVESLYNIISEKYPKLDIAINNVGTASLKPLTEITEEEFDNTINVNLKSLWMGLKHQIKMMFKDQNTDKKIINIASINGLGGAEYLSIYAAAKAGVISLTKSAALETAKSNITINAIVPGPFDTPMLHHALNLQSGGDTDKKKAIEAQYKQFIPEGRFGDPEELAKTVLWLCEGDVKYISGHSFIIDGGMTSRFR
ncbi:SDR family NAD(P)-dependent oxidoreductase [uncultured Psychroserpens sp.]|uniref:SDR family NAD(P)-dependent oxidoreductase n=1 Tax=uncultured Psychroserpens sp. TaxID=255436 RepID=UPI002612568D|nr:SDR family oxidoreductase [uncultured Psychroserpens sp.]